MVLKRIHPLSLEQIELDDVRRLRQTEPVENFQHVLAVRAECLREDNHGCLRQSLIDHGGRIDTRCGGLSELRGARSIGPPRRRGSTVLWSAVPRHGG